MRTIWLFLLFGAISAFAGVFDTNTLFQTPKSQPIHGFDRPGVKSVLLDGERYQGKPTLIFAYYGIPKGATKEKPVPGMVLVHGGAGTAFDSWVRTWNERGYAAIAMDTCGGVPPWTRKLGTLHHAYSGPRGWGCFSEGNLPEKEQWPYHAISSVIRAHSFLRSLPGVDSARIGLTGISWGGYLTACVAGVDSRFRFAAPVYGCAYLGDHSVWSAAIRQLGDTGKRWSALWDPSVFLPQAKMLMLWCTGSNDHFFPLDSWQRGYQLPAISPQLAARVRMVHSHPPQGDPPEIRAFADALLFGKPKLPKVESTSIQKDVLTVMWSAQERKVTRAELVWTESDDPVWEKRFYQTRSVPVAQPLVASVPAAARIFWVNLWTAENLLVSTPHCER